MQQSLEPGRTSSTTKSIARPRRGTCAIRRHKPSDKGRAIPERLVPSADGYASEWAVVNYTMFRISRNAFFTVRNEYMNDRVGARTGFATQYSEHSIGITWWPDKLITIRPELRFDHSYDAKAYNLGRDDSQLAFITDMIYHF